MDHPGEHGRHKDVKKCADDQGSNDPDRQVALGVSGFLRRRRHRIESDVGEEYVGRTGSDPGEAMGGE